MGLFKRKKTINKTKEVDSIINKVKNFEFFPLVEDEQGASWKMDQRLALPAYLLEDEFQRFMQGGFNHRGLAMMTLNFFLKNGWLPPDITKEEVEKMKI